MAVESMTQLVEKVPVQQLAQPAVKTLAGYAFGQVKVQHDSVGELLVTLHLTKMLLYTHLILQQPLHLPAPSLPIGSDGGNVPKLLTRFTR
jgi:hypothetical protein